MYRIIDFIKSKKILFFIFLAYCSIIISIYFINFGTINYIDTITNYQGIYRLFNLVPFRNITIYFQRIGTDFPIALVVRNLVYPILLWFPFGILFKILFYKNIKFNDLKAFLFISLGIIVFYLARVLMLLGFFDIDKIMLNLIGIYIGFLFYNNFIYKKNKED
jgi:glycopeptide antibiotics resistance protein